MLRTGLSVILLAGLLLLTDIGWAQAPKLPKVGDKVKAVWVRSLWDAAIVKTDGSLITVRWADGSGEEALHPSKIHFNGKPLTSAKLQDKTTVKPVATPENDKERGMREWVDATGKFKTEAAFQAVVDGKVELRKADGTLARLPLDKLSAADQALAKKLAEAPEADPFASVPESADMQEAGPVEIGELTITPTNHADANTKTLGEPSAPFLPDPFVKTSLSNAKPQIDLGAAKHDFWEEPECFVLHPPTKQGIALTKLKEPGSKATSRCMAFDLSTGKITSEKELSKSQFLLEFSPDGKHLLGRSNEFGFGGKTRLDVWSFAPTTGIKHAGSMQPFGTDKWESDISHMFWIDNQHIATTQKDGLLVVWQVPQFKPVYAFAMGREVRPAASGTGEQLAVGTATGVAVLNATTGDTLAVCNGPDWGTVLGFSPDGKQLAAVGSRGVAVWDLTTSNLQHEIYVPWIAQHDPAQTAARWVDKDLVAVSYGETTTLIDLKRKVAAWRYGASGHEICMSYWDNHAWLFTKHNKHFGLAHFEVPHAAAKQKIASISEEDSTFFKPGTAVALSINVSLPEDDIQQIRTALTKQIESLGMTIAEQSPITLEVTTELGKPQEMAYRTFGAGGATQTVSFTPTYSKVELKVNGEKQWSDSSSSSAHHHIQLKEGQTLEMAVAEQTKPSANFFKSVKLPKVLARHPGNGVYGNSFFTVKGIE